VVVGSGIEIFRVKKIALFTGSNKRHSSFKQVRQINTPEKKKELLSGRNIIH